MSREVPHIPRATLSSWCIRGRIGQPEQFNQFGHRLQLELLHAAFAMGVCGAVADAKFGGDLFQPVPSCEPTA